jgi:hypothetical protein
MFRIANTAAIAIKASRGFVGRVDETGITSGIKKCIVLAVELGSSRNVAIRHVNWRKRPTGSNFWSMGRSFRQIGFQLCGKNATNSSQFLLRF